MKALIWSVFTLLASLWTLFAWILSSLVQWVAQVAQGGDLQAAVRTVAEWPMPEWMAWWMDPGWVRMAQSALVWTLENLGGTLPSLGTLIGWLSPLIWGVWFLVAVLLLIAAGIGHALAGRSSMRAARG
jgi:hypothetical protein